MFLLILAGLIAVTAAHTYFLIKGTEGYLYRSELLLCSHFYLHRKRLFGNRKISNMHFQEVWEVLLKACHHDTGVRPR